MSLRLRLRYCGRQSNAKWALFNRNLQTYLPQAIIYQTKNLLFMVVQVFDSEFFHQFTLPLICSPSSVRCSCIMRIDGTLLMMIGTSLL